MATKESSASAYKQLVRLQCYDALAEVGFSRFRKQGVDFPLGDGFHCWVGLNMVTESGCVLISPFVGLHVAPIMQFCASLEGRKYDRGIATYAVHMGELAPHESAFRFDRNTDVKAEVFRLARLYVDVGVPFARSNASFERLLPLLKKRVAGLGGYPERVASCLYLMDRKDEARAFVEEFVTQQPAYFGSFARSFSRNISMTGSGLSS